MKKVTNYRTDVLSNFSKKELIEHTEISPIFVEKYEIELFGGKHIAEVNGPDGIMPNGQHLEVKTQLYSGNYKFHGRGKFGGVSQSILDSKLENNEKIIMIGYDQPGEVFYRFNFDFTAIASNYKKTIKTTQTTKWSNYDTYPSHYTKHKSFNVQYVASDKILKENEFKFQPKFFDFLSKINEGGDPKSFY